MPLMSTSYVIQFEDSSFHPQNRHHGITPSTEDIARACKFTDRGSALYVMAERQRVSLPTSRWFNACVKSIFIFAEELEE